MVGLPLREREPRLLGVQLVDRSRVVARRGQDLLELLHVRTLRTHVERPVEGEVARLGDRVAAVDGEDRLTGLHVGAVVEVGAADAPLSRGVDLALLDTAEGAAQRDLVLQRLALHGRGDDEVLVGRAALVARGEHHHSHDDERDGCSRADPLLPR